MEREAKAMIAAEAAWTKCRDGAAQGTDAGLRRPQRQVAQSADGLVGNIAAPESFSTVRKALDRSLLEVTSKHCLPTGLRIMAAEGTTQARWRSLRQTSRSEKHP